MNNKNKKLQRVSCCPNCKGKDLTLATEGAQDFDGKEHKIIKFHVGCNNCGYPLAAVFKFAYLENKDFYPVKRWNDGTRKDKRHV